MYISLAVSCANGFKKWSDANRPTSNNDDGDIADNTAITIAPSEIDYPVMTSAEMPHGMRRGQGAV